MPLGDFPKGKMCAESNCILRWYFRETINELCSQTSHDWFRGTAWRTLCLPFFQKRHGLFDSGRHWGPRRCGPRTPHIKLEMLFLELHRLHRVLRFIIFWRNYLHEQLEVHGDGPYRRVETRDHTRSKRSRLSSNHNTTSSIFCETFVDMLLNFRFSS